MLYGNWRDALLGRFTLLQAPFSVSHSQLKAKCAAFKGGACPYSVLPKEMKGIAAKCPAFKDGCPWKDCTTVGEYVEMMAKMRCHHLKGGQTAYKKFFARVHEVSKGAEAKLGVCPFQQNKCQFSNDAHGKPIIPN